MSRAEFDRFADKYDQTLGESMPVGMSEDSYFAEYKIALMASRLPNKKINRILDFGCGSGRSLSFLGAYFPESEIWGYDVSPVSLELAAKQLPRANLFSSWGMAEKIRFDAIIAANVFHHIPPELRLQSLSDCRKVLEDGGDMFVFEHNPFNPLTRWIFERCPFDVNAEMLSLKTTASLAKKAGFSSCEYGYTLFFPRPLAFLRWAEPWLGWLPLGAQYFVKLTK